MSDEKVITRESAVPVPSVPQSKIIPTINRITCVASVYHTYNGQQPSQFDLNYSAGIADPEQAYIRERVLLGATDFPVTFDFLEGKVGTVIIQNVTGANPLAVQPTPEQAADIASCVLRVRVGELRFLVRPGRFMMFELDDVSQPIVVSPSNYDHQHHVKIIGLPK